MDQRIEGFIWLDWVVDKIIQKHGVAPEEVEQAFFKPPYRIRRAAGNKYLFLSRTDAGRYLAIVFVWQGRNIRVVTARDMDESERQLFRRK